MFSKAESGCLRREAGLHEGGRGGGGWGLHGGGRSLSPAVIRLGHILLECILVSLCICGSR